MMRICQWLSSASMAVTTLSILVALAILLAPIVCWATEFRGGDVVHLREGEILDDLFIAGGDVSVNTHILGDLFAAGRTVTVGDSALIENSFAGAGQRVDINGHIINSARATGQDISVRGHIERNLMVFGATLILDESGWVENDISAYGDKLIVRGRVGGDITGEVEELVISGQIDGDVSLEANTVTILSSAIIGGHLKYTSENEANIADGAQIFEGVERIEPKEQETGYSLGSFLWDAWWFFASYIVGIVLLVLFRRFLVDIKDTMLASSLVSIGLGFLFLVCLPVAASVMAITLLGIPLAILVLVLWIVLLYVAKIFVGLAVGEWLLARMRGGHIFPTPISLLVGLFILSIVVLIPYAGFLVKVMIVSLGFGAFFVTAYRYRNRTA